MEEMKPIAYKSISNVGGIEILCIDDGLVVVRDNYYGEPSKCHISKIRFNAKGESYFMHNGHREYLREYLRCKIGS